MGGQFCLSRHGKKSRISQPGRDQQPDQQHGQNRLMPVAEALEPFLVFAQERASFGFFGIEIYPVCACLFPRTCVDGVDEVDGVDSFPVHDSWFLVESRMSKVLSGFGLVPL
jgi:hypothetical protein